MSPHFLPTLFVDNEGQPGTCSQCGSSACTRATTGASPTATRCGVFERRADAIAALPAVVRAHCAKYYSVDAGTEDERSPDAMGTAAGSLGRSKSRRIPTFVDEMVGGPVEPLVGLGPSGEVVMLAPTFVWLILATGSLPMSSSDNYGIDAAIASSPKRAKELRAWCQSITLPLSDGTPGKCSIVKVKVTKAAP